MSSPSLTIDELAKALKRLAVPGKTTIVAIAGPPGSGKSSLAATLVERIGPTACAVPMDGFHLDNETLEARGLLPRKGAPETFDLAGFLQLVESLKAGATRRFPTFDRDLDSVIPEGGLVPEDASLLLFEGNYLLFGEEGWVNLAQKWDASIWLDVPVPVLEARLIRRWLDQGLPEAQATARARMNDLPNARRVIEKALPATWTKCD